MARRFPVDSINLSAYEIKPFVNEKYTGFVIKWDSCIGFGEYTIYKAIDSTEWHADSEHMDNDENKDFLKELLKQFIEKINIEN